MNCIPFLLAEQVQQSQVRCTPHPNWGVSSVLPCVSGFQVLQCQFLAKPNNGGRYCYSIPGARSTVSIKVKHVKRRSSRFKKAQFQVLFCALEVDCKEMPSLPLLFLLPLDCNCSSTDTTTAPCHVPPQTLSRSPPPLYCLRELQIFWEI